MKHLVLTAGLFLAAMLTANAQSLVKMSVPKQSDKPLQVVALFDEEIPQDMPVVLGVMGYKVTGGITPYSFEWLQNGAVVGTNDIVVLHPKKGDQIDLRVKDTNRCISSTTFNLRFAALPKNEEGPGEIRVFPTLVTDGVIHVALPELENQAPALIRIFDVNGALCYTQTTTASSLDMQVNLQAGMYFVAVASEGKQMVVKVVVE